MYKFDGKVLIAAVNEWATFLTAHTPHTHPFNGPFSGTTQVSPYQKGKTNLDFTEARDSEWQWHQLGLLNGTSAHIGHFSAIVNRCTASWQKTRCAKMIGRSPERTWKLSDVEKAKHTQGTTCELPKRTRGSIELCHLRPEGPIAGGGVLAEGTAGPVPTSKGVWRAL